MDGKIHSDIQLFGASIYPPDFYFILEKSFVSVESNLL